MQLNCECGNRTTLNGNQARTLSDLRQPFTCPRCGKVRPLPPWAGSGGGRGVTVVLLMTAALVLMVVSAAAGFAVRDLMRFPGSAPVKIPAPVAAVVPAANASPEQAAVRNYLKEHTASGEWSEVRWWNPQTISEPMNLDDVADEMTGQDVPQKPLVKLVRLRFRSRNGSGHLSIHDEFFIVKDGKAIAQPEGRFELWRMKIPD